MTRSVFVVSALLLAAPASAQIGREPVALTQSHDQATALRDAAARIVPRRPDGTPHANGRVVLLTIGMSNTRQVSEGVRVVLKRETADVYPAFVLVNGAQGGQAAKEWADPACACWGNLGAILAKQHVTDAQVQAVFLMTTVKRPKVDAETTAAHFAAYTRQILALIEARFSNVQIIIPSANYFGGYDIGQDKTPEAHQWQQTTTLQDIQDSWTGRAALVAWHPWTDGPRVRADGLNLEQSDMTDRGVHLATSGKLKVARTLRDWLWAQDWTHGWLR